ncbi:hypothetical protein EN35_12880 [Rhodococcus qingshengii]|nr:hypothetical protein EN35_12880 [Rhodococcus qingshengii]
MDYRLAPENPYPAALDDAVSAFMQLVTEFDYSEDRVAIAGDSAGGGLAAATAIRLIERHGVTPGALALISPWVDPGDRGATKKADLVVNTAWSFDAADATLPEATVLILATRRCTASSTGCRPPGFTSVPRKSSTRRS